MYFFNVAIDNAVKDDGRGGDWSININNLNNFLSSSDNINRPQTK